MTVTDTPVLSLTFGNFIRNARLEKNLTQSEVAARAKVEQAYLSKVERDAREPSLTIALRICDALGLDINDFVKQCI
jgi:transcriptional regulator with XRE-family HTH domain